MSKGGNTVFRHFLFFGSVMWEKNIISIDVEKSNLRKKNLQSVFHAR